MSRQPFRTIALCGFGILVAAGVASRAQGVERATPPYPKMAPIEQYRMQRDAEIALARSAAPQSISRDAEIMVLGEPSYQTAVKGKNGFVRGRERPHHTSKNHTRGPARLG